VFISGLQVTNPLYKRLLKHSVARMSKVLSRAQPYVKLEEALSPTTPRNRVMVEERKSTKAPDHAQDRHRGQPAYKKQALLIHSPSPLQNYKSMERYTPLKLPINKIFSTIKDQPWVRCPRPIQHNPSLPGLEEYAPTTTAKGARPSTVRPSEGTWKSSSNKTSSKRVHPHSQSNLQTTNTQPSREQRLVAQYYVID